MTRPVLKVEIAFDSGVSTPAASRVWTDVTSYVLMASGVGIDHGRGDEFSTAGPNSVRLVFDNSDGRFTPGLATGAYYPNVKRGRPIRVTSTPAGGSGSTRYVGYIDSYEQGWPGIVGSFATTMVTATSRLARVGIGAELRSIVEEEYLLDSPTAYYPLGEAEGSTSAADVSGNSASTLRQKGTGTAVVFGSATGPSTDGLTAASFTKFGKYLRQDGPATGSAGNLTLECFMSYTASADGPAGEDGRFLSWGEFYLRADGVFNRIRFAGPGFSITDAVAYDDGQTRHFAGTYNNTTGAVALYVNGVEVATGTGTVGQGTVPDGLSGIGGTSSANDAGITGVIAHAAGFRAALSATRIDAHSDAGLDGFASETAAARLARYAAYAGIPAAETSFETGDVTNLAHIDTTGKTALACMREVETTEGGVLFDARDNTSTFHDRSHRYNSTAVLTLDVAAGEVQPDYAPKLDNFGLFNDVTAATTDGTVTARVIDQTSIDDEGLARDSLDLATTNAEDPFQRASWIVGNYADPDPRVPTLTVELAKLSAARQATILAVNVGDKVTVTNLMDQSDAATKSFFVEGYTETIGEGSHLVVFSVSPAAVFEGLLILDHATSGQLDQEALAY